MNYKSDLNYNDHLSLPNRSMHVAVLQMKGWRNDFSESKARLLEIVRDAGQRDVRIFVAPECVCSEYCFSSSKDAEAFGETLDGEFAQDLSQHSVKSNMWCFVGLIERGEHNRLFNSVLITNPNGQKQFYRKRLLFDADYLWATSGDEYPNVLPKDQQLSAFGLDGLVNDHSPPYPLFNIDGWRVTVGICMDFNDLRFINFCVHSDVDLIAFPTNWIDQGQPVLNYWAALMQDMRYTTLLAANSYGPDGEYRLSGRSAILQANPPTLLGEAPEEGDFLMTCTLENLRYLTTHKEQIEI